MLNNYPTVSIIIPCRNEVDFVESCLDSIFNFEDVPGGFDVWIVDGMSEDGTRDLLQTWSLKKQNLHVLDNPDKIVPVALNMAIRQAMGRYLVRLDVHSTYPPKYLRLCVDTAEKTKADNVGGLFITKSRGDGFEAQLVQSLTTHRFGVGNAGYRLGAEAGFADTVPYGCYRNEIFEKVGYFDERLVRNQDYEFNQRIIKTGGKIWRNPEIHINYYNQDTLRGLFRQAVFTGCWNPWTWYLAPYAFNIRHAVPGIFVAGLGLGILSILFSPLGWILLSCMLGAYAFLSVISSLMQAKRFGWWQLPILPVLFFVYHLSYGIGILKGFLALLTGRTPVQKKREPWPGAGRKRAL